MHSSHPCLSHGAAGDVERVSKEDREKAKRVTYGERALVEGREGGRGAGTMASWRMCPAAAVSPGAQKHLASLVLLPFSPSSPAGIIYGLTAFGLAQGSGGLGISVGAAQVGRAGWSSSRLECTAGTPQPGLSVSLPLCRVCALLF